VARLNDLLVVQPRPGEVVFRGVYMHYTYFRGWNYGFQGVFILELGP